MMLIRLDWDFEERDRGWEEGLVGVLGVGEGLVGW